MNVFFNTQSQAPRCFLQLTGEMFLTPVRFWCNGRTVQEIIKITTNSNQTTYVLKECRQVEDLAQIASKPEYWDKPWAKQVMPLVIKIAMAVLFLPGLVIGATFKLVAHGNCLFPYLLKPVIVQQYKYNTLLDKKTTNYKPLEEIADSATDRDYCVYQGQVVELLQRRHLGADSGDETKITHCAEDIKFDNGYNYKGRTFYFDQPYVIDEETARHFGSEKNSRSPRPHTTLSVGFWKTWNPQATVVA